MTCKIENLCGKCTGVPIKIYKNYIVCPSQESPPPPSLSDRDPPLMGVPLLTGVKEGTPGRGTPVRGTPIMKLNWRSQVLPLYNNLHP